MAEPTIYDIRKAVLTVNGQEITDVGEDGFGITPDAERTIIKGLKGDIGFNIDPTSSAVCVINLKASSAGSAFLNDIYRKQQTGDFGPIPVEITVDPDHVDAFGFAKRGMRYAMVQKPAPFETDGKESPEIEWMLIGYEYYEE